MNELFLLPAAKRYFKKLKDTKLKDLFRENLEKIKDNPTIGQTKTGDLNGIYTYGFKYKNTDYRIAYKVTVNLNGTLTIIIMAGTRENFYESLKAYIN